MTARLIDTHSHWGTKRGYVLQTKAELDEQMRTWHSAPRYRTESEMADELRAANVRVILDFGFTKFLPVTKARAVHDYGFEFQRQHADVVLGHWIHVQADKGKPALREFRRCLDKGGFVGLAVSGSGGLPASDRAWQPFYKLCIEAKAPALIFVGHTGLGAGLPGGMGVILDHCHPRHLDMVAAKNPDLNIVAARPGWPWQAETISVLLHKRNIWYELHGWSPKYFTPDLKHDIPRRLADRVMFGADYPLLGYERLVADWRTLGYSEEVLEKVFFRNAERFLAGVGR